MAKETEKIQETANRKTNILFELINIILFALIEYIYYNIVE
jgi:hypothetical protein